jgi:hypothetical protein
MACGGVTSRSFTVSLCSLTSLRLCIWVRVHPRSYVRVKRGGELMGPLNWKHSVWSRCMHLLIGFATFVDDITGIARVCEGGITTSGCVWALATHIHDSWPLQTTVLLTVILGFDQGAICLARVTL